MSKTRSSTEADVAVQKVAPAEDKANVLQVKARAGVSQERQLADLATDGIATNAVTARSFLGPSQPHLSITEMVDSLKDHGKRVNDNDLAAPEQMLMAQAVSLNAIFAEMSRRAAMNMGSHLEPMERYLRLALKAQGQCRATVETLAAIKNPPVVFAKQANIAHGPQQVNNGVAANFETSTPARASAHGKTENEQTELLEGAQHGGTLMDAGATATAAGGHTALETVGAVNRTDEPRRKDARKP